MNRKEIATRMYTEGWNQGKMGVFDEHVAVDAPNNDHTGMPSPPGREGLKQLIQMYRAAFPDVRFGIDLVLEDGNHVVVRWTASGTNTGSMMGMPPTGKAVTTRGANIYRFQGDTMVESWGHWDNLAFLQQLGLAPTLG